MIIINIIYLSALHTLSHLKLTACYEVEMLFSLGTLRLGEVPTHCQVIYLERGTAGTGIESPLRTQCNVDPVPFATCRGRFMFSRHYFKWEELSYWEAWDLYWAKQREQKESQRWDGMREVGSERCSGSRWPCWSWSAWALMGPHGASWALAHSTLCEAGTTFFLLSQSILEAQ